jgi:hypothetical protein
MAGRGFPPANGSKSAKAQDTIRLVADGKLRGFPLPSGWVTNPKTGEVEDWHPATVKWWTDWRKSPQATRMLTRVDWDYLLDTALLHHRMWKTGNVELASEVRLRVANFGATIADRQRLRADIALDNPQPSETVEPAEPSAGRVSDISERRERMTG